MAAPVTADVGRAAGAVPLVMPRQQFPVADDQSGHVAVVVGGD
jgi:hypothetical protein